MATQDEEKQCSKCRQSKPRIEFHRSSSRVDGLRPYCKSCRKTEENPAQVKKRGRNWYERNRDQVIKSSRKWVEEHPELRKKWRDGYYLKNAPDLKAKVSAWQRLNPHIVAWRTLLTNTLQRFGKKKSRTTIESLGYSAEDLKRHMESLWTPGMSWDNYGEWHIDHVRPLSSFDSETDPRIVNRLENLQPLWATTRTIDGVEYEGNLNKNARWAA